MNMYSYSHQNKGWDISNGTRYDGFLPPVQCISAPGTTLFGPVVCLHCFNFVNTPPPPPPPSKINMKPRWEVKLWGYFQGMFWKFYHDIEIIDSFLITQHINSDLEYFCLWFSNTQSVYHASVTMYRYNKFTRWLVHSPLLFTCQNSTDRNWSPMLTSKWATTWNVIFHDEIRFHKPDMLWRTHAWLRGHFALT